MPVITLPESCQGCGACCYGLRVDVDDADLTKYGTPEATTVVDPDDGRRYLKQVAEDHGRCVNLDPETKTCTIYEHRPQVCRDFNRGDEEGGNDLCFEVVSGLRVEQGRMVVPEPNPEAKLLHLLRLFPTRDLDPLPLDLLIALRHLLAQAHTRIDTQLTTDLAQRVRDAEVEIAKAPRYKGGTREEETPDA